MSRMVLEIRGGVLVGAYSDDAAIELTLVDWDDFDPIHGHLAVGHFEHAPLRTIPVETAEVITRSGQTGLSSRRC